MGVSVFTPNTNQHNTELACVICSQNQLQGKALHVMVECNHVVCDDHLPRSGCPCTVCAAPTISHPVESMEQNPTLGLLVQPPEQSLQRANRVIGQTVFSELATINNAIKVSDTVKTLVSDGP